MKKKIDADIMKLYGIITGLVAICIVICAVHVTSLTGSYREAILDKINVQTQMTSQVLSKMFEKNIEIVTAEAAEMAHKGGLSHTVICDALVECERQGRFQDVYFINSIGTVYHPDGSLTQVAIDEYTEMVDESLDGGIYLDNNSSNDDELSFMAIAPVIAGGLFKGYFVGVDSTASILDHVTLGYLDDSAISYMTTNEGTILSATNNAGGGNADNIFDYLLEQAKNPEQMEEMLNEGRVSQERRDPIQQMLSLKEANIYVSSYPIEGTKNWNYFCCLYDSTIDVMVRPIAIRAILTCVSVILIMLTLVVVVWKHISKDQTRMEELAYCDTLTGAKNLHHFEMKARELLDDNRDLPYAVICFDIVNFRYMNEGYGHEKADAILTALVKAANESFSYNETFSRISADKFVCLAIDDGRDKARKEFVEERVNRYANTIAVNYPIRIKSGFYVITDYTEQIPSMIDKADLARKSITGESKKLFAYYEDSLIEETRRREYIESQMEEALENGEFVPYLQPKWDMIEDRIAGAEALVRWIKPDGSMIYPNDFIPIFEKNGFVEKLDFYMLESICKYVRRLLDEGKPVYPVSINQSRYLLHNKAYVRMVQDILLKYEIPKDYVELELTETVFFLERDHMVSVMSKLKDINVMLSIDDFGSGFSSLNLLKDIPFDVLKIDRGFLDETATSKASRWILLKIVEMAEGLGVKVVCEGVETKEQAEMLKEIGCHIAQGYLYAKPMPITQFEETYNC